MSMKIVLFLFVHFFKIWFLLLLVKSRIASAMDGRYFCYIQLSLGYNFNETTDIKQAFTLLKWYAYNVLFPSVWILQWGWTN